jgi:hypothetical protein
VKLTYWYAQCKDDHNCYSVRKRTKREALAAVAEQPESYGKVVKVTVEYSDGFELLDMCNAEGGLYQETMSNSYE